MSRLPVGMPVGLPGLLKEGFKHFSGVEEAVLRNIDACKELSRMTATSLGPNGERASSQSSAEAESGELSKAVAQG